MFSVFNKIRLVNLLPMITFNQNINAFVCSGCLIGK